MDIKIEKGFVLIFGDCVHVLQRGYGEEIFQDKYNNENQYRPLKELPGYLLESGIPREIIMEVVKYMPNVER